MHILLYLIFYSLYLIFYSFYFMYTSLVLYFSIFALSMERTRLTFHCWLYNLCIVVYVTNKTWNLKLERPQVWVFGQGRLPAPEFWSHTHTPATHPAHSLGLLQKHTSRLTSLSGLICTKWTTYLTSWTPALPLAIVSSVSTLPLLSTVFFAYKPVERDYLYTHQLQRGVCIHPPIRSAIHDLLHL